MDSKRAHDNIFDVYEGVVSVFQPVPNPSAEDDSTVAEMTVNEVEDTFEPLIQPSNRDLPSQFRSWP